MKDKGIILSILGFTLLIIIGGGFLVGKASSATNIQASLDVKIQIEERSFAWGEIKYDGAKAAKTFKIKNAGTDTLKVWNVKTSCACTSAQIRVGQDSSPLFSMHTNSSWVGQISPGAEAELEVVFDQRYHGPSGVGQITRQITMQTNDSSSPSLEFSLSGTVTK